MIILTLDPLPGFEIYMTTMYGLITPCLHKQSAALGISAFILLHGSSGTGKSALSHWISESLGLNIFRVLVQFL